MILVAANQLGKSYGGRTLFENVSFGIEERARVGLVGPNGAGKSTLLRMLAGEAEPDSGNVARKRGLRLGYLEQMPAFPEGQTLMQALLAKAEDPHEALPRALTLRAQLELGRFGDDFEVAKLSGGWRKRVALARELVTEPELLFLDEPTNHLDVSGILWLENFLQQAPLALLMITHDRLFLQRTVNHVLDLDPRNPNYLLNVKGDYVTYLEAKEHELAALQRQERVLKNTLRREREWLSRGSIARQTKQSARIQSAADLADTVDGLREKNSTRRLDLDFGDTGTGPQRLISATGLSMAYDDQPLFENLDVLITPKTRLALLGDNGSGKSTLVRLLLGLETPTSGKVQRADPLKVSYFEQGRETLNPALSVLKNICPEGDYVSFQGQFVHARSYLDRFLFQGNKAEMPAAKLSGGEQARLRLAQLMLQPAQVLVLDEPTNDLDSDTLDVLEESLQGFSGGVILVTHDRYFMDAVCNQILAFPPLDMRALGLQKFASYFQWESWFESARRKSTAAAAPAKSKDAAAPARVKLSYKEKFELENMEATILAMESELEALTQESQAVVDDHKRLSELHSLLAERQSQLDAKYERWASLEAKAKGLA
jgi:ATP-binding cassette subfamily F protein uup